MGTLRGCVSVVLYNIVKDLSKLEGTVECSPPRVSWRSSCWDRSTAFSNIGGFNFRVAINIAVARNLCQSI